MIALGTWPYGQDNGIGVVDALMSELFVFISSFVEMAPSIYTLDTKYN